jgi:hypothetical protein
VKNLAPNVRIILLMIMHIEGEELWSTPSLHSQLRLPGLTRY